MKQWFVSAVPRAGFDGFRRGGLFFPAYPDGAHLVEEQITPAIRSEPMLIIAAAQAEPDDNKPSPSKPK